jgi:sulfite exporter TauE/SafE
VIGYGLYLLLFAIGTLPVVLVTSCLSQADDRAMLRDLPRRALVFAGSCAALTAVLLAIGAWIG